MMSTYRRLLPAAVLRPPNGGATAAEGGVNPSVEFGWTFDGGGVWDDLSAPDIPSVGVTVFARAGGGGGGVAGVAVSDPA
jgi:hypothetical protein